MFKNMMLVASIVLLSGCIATDKGEDKSAAQFEKVNTNLSNLEQSLASTIQDSCQQDNEQLANQVAAAVAANTITEKVEPEKEIVYVEVCSTKEDDVIVSKTEKFVIGEVENVTLVKEKLNFNARIDTGAVTSSLGVFNETRFERDGEKWIRFTLDKEKDAKKYEYPIARIIRIIQQTSTDTSKRPIIKMRFQIGGKTYTSEFSLADRSHLEYQVLIGREFIKDRALVDVSSKFLLGGD